MTTGSLGQGFSAAVGMAKAIKMDGKENHVFAIIGDGESQEGQIWEAAIYAAAKKIDNVIATVDYNGRQIDGDLEDVMSLGNLSNGIDS